MKAAAASEKPTVPEYVARAKGLLWNKRADEAIEVLQAGLAVERHPEGSYLLGKALLDAGRAAEARFLLRQLVNATGDVFASALLARACLATGDAETAVDTARAALRSAPDDPELSELVAVGEAQLEERRTVARGDAAALARPADACEVDQRPTTRVPLDEAAEAEQQQTERLSRSEATQRYGPLFGQAPDLETAVKRFVRAAYPVDAARSVGARDPAEVPTERLVTQSRWTVPLEPAAAEPRPERLSGPVSAASEETVDVPLPAVDAPLPPDPDGLGGPTPAATPAALHRRRRAKGIAAVPPRVDYDISSRATGERRPTPSGVALPRAAERGNTPPAEPGLFEITPSEDEAPTPPTSAAGRRGSDDATVELRRKMAPTPSELALPRALVDEVDEVESASAPAVSQVEAAVPLVARTRRRERSAAPTASRPKQSSLAELREQPTSDLIPIAAVKVSRPDAPTAGGFRLALGEPPIVPGRGRARRTTPDSGQVVPLRGHAANVALTPQRSLARRLWPLWLGLTLALLGGAVVVGLLMFRQQQARHHLILARQLATTDQVWSLRSALEHARRSADLGRRSAEIVALAARIHARLAFEFGASPLSGVASLVEESKRLGAPYEKRAAVDLRLAEAYLKLATTSLPEALSFLEQTLANKAVTDELRLLQAVALTRAGELARAGRAFAALADQHTPRVLRARARLAWARGAAKRGRRLLSQAGELGLGPQQVDLELARFAVGKRKASARTLHRLLSLLEDKGLSAVERAWAELLAASALHDHGRRDESLRALKRALAKRPLADPAFHLVGAQQLLRLGRHEGALREVGRALWLAPRMRAAVGTKARVLVGMDRPREAIELLEGVDRRSPRETEALVAAFLRRGEVRKARRLVGQMGPGTALRRQIVTARLALAEGKPYQVLRELSGLPPERRREAEVQLLRGLASLRTRQWAAADRFLRAALARDAGLAEAHWAMGRLWRHKAEAAEARKALSQAVQLNPYRRRFQLDVGRLLLDVGDFAAAEKHFSAVLARDAHDLAALAGRARARVELKLPTAGADLRALRKAGHRNRARLLAARRAMLDRRWRRAAARLRRIEGSWLRAEPRALLWRAEVEQHTDRRQAAKSFRKLLRWRLTRPAALLGLSELNVRRGRLREALKQARAAARALKAAAIYPVQLRVRIGMHLAAVQKRSGSLGAAIAQLEEVLALMRTHYAANLRLGQIYLALKNPKRAVRHLALAREARPHARSARKLLRRACRALPQSNACR